VVNTMQGFSIEGYAIVSADGMIADRNGHMPDGLKCDADARFFTEGLDSAALVVHGRHSHERQGSASDRRRRMIVSDRSLGFSVHASIPNAWVWNPASMAFEKACRGIWGDGREDRSQRRDRSVCAVPEDRRCQAKHQNRYYRSTV
jgi:hypothetical protein